MEEKRYTYKPKTTTFIFPILFFLICAVVLGKLALQNKEVLLINGILELNVSQATTFYWVLFTFSVLLILSGSFALLKGFMSFREIVVTGKQISAPKSGISSKIIHIEFHNISNIDVIEINRQKMLKIIHSEGTLTIPKNMLSGRGEFDELFLLLLKKI
ncbi:MAG: hypothetical protein COA58_00890 [Bacteroidetes bacterium]|nr:MAG: hypothetical protein COA58_00890 [Bacteroidota bacterium]